jgi:hypothetical protein
MPVADDNWLFITDLRGGRNGVDPAISLRTSECAEAVNVDWYNSLVARKRAGAAAISMAGTALVGTVSWLGRHVPSSDETLAEMWATDDSATPVVERMAANVRSTPTLKESPTGNGWDFSGVSLNGLFFLAYKSASDRLKVWDGSTVRFAGLAAPSAAPTGADTGVGTYAATVRYYRVRATVQVAGVTTRRSEPSAVLTATPSGTGTGYVVTRPTLPGEGETHWEIEASPDNTNFFLLSTIIAATTTYTDSALTSSYASNTVSAITGTYTVPKSYKFIAADQNRLLGFGAYTSTNKQNRIEISAVVGSLNIGDAERVPTSSYVDLDENDSGPATGLIGPVNGSYYAFKFRQIWKLTPTGNTTTPYAATCLSKHIGAVNSRSITVAEDENGDPVVHFMSDRGPYRFGTNGLEYIGKGVEDLTTAMLLGANIPCVALYVRALRQVWFYICTSGNYPNKKLMWQIGRSGNTSASDHPVPSGWAQHTGDSCAARAAILFANTIGATMSLDQKPYIAYAGAAAKIWKADTGTDDNGTTYQAYVTSKVYYPWGLMRNGSIVRGYLLALAASGVTVRLTITPDYDAANNRTFDVLLTPAATETRIRKKFEDVAMGNVGCMQFTLGDSAAISNSWQLDAAVFETFPQEIA